jgi:hypothetical protein
MTGVAATLIKGETAHSAFGINSNSAPDACTIHEWQANRLTCLDEISFADHKFLDKLHSRKSLLHETRGKMFGGRHIVFSGDFSQLPPIKNEGLYSQKGDNFWRETINCFVELVGLHRFSSDIEYGRTMMRFRMGVPTQADFDKINSRIQPNASLVPPSTKYATYQNQPRSELNVRCFLEHIRKTHSRDPNKPIPSHTILIEAGNLNWCHKNGNIPLSPMSKQTLFNHCRDSHVTSSSNSSRFFAPILNLFVGMPIMNTFNKDVKNREANGTIGTVKCIVLKRTEDGSSVLCKCQVDGYYVHCVSADNVEKVICEFVTKDGQEECNNFFEVTPENLKVKANFPVDLHMMPGLRRKILMKITQFPIISNFATTVHKLQGVSTDTIYVYEWKNATNWIYVVLSRVKSLNGLYIRKRLDDNRDFKLDDRIVEMLNYFSRTCSPSIDIK